MTRIGIKNFYNFILKSLKLQLFINLCILPIFWYWNLPISLINPISNIFFAPFLSLFLIFSSAIFFTELLYIPNGLLINILENITCLWIWITSKLNFNPLFVFAKPAWPFGLIIPLIALICLKHRNLQKKNRSFIALGVIWSILIFCNTTVPARKGIYYVGNPENESIILSSNNSKFLILKYLNKRDYYNETTKIIDCLLKIRIKKLNLLITKEANIAVFKGLIQFTKILEVEKIYLPENNHPLLGEEFKYWLLLLDVCSKKKIKIYKISANCSTSNLNSFNDSLLTVTLWPIFLSSKRCLAISGALGERLFTA